MNVFADIILFLGCLFATAAFLLPRGWTALYMAFTAIVCVGTVAIAAQVVEPIKSPINAAAASISDRAEPTPAPATLAAIHALYVANDTAQRAVDNDVCGEAADFIDVTLAGDSLSGEDKRQYRHVRDALNAAYMTGAGDEELAIIQRDFCFGASER